MAETRGNKKFLPCRRRRDNDVYSTPLWITARISYGSHPTDWLCKQAVAFRKSAGLCSRGAMVKRKCAVRVPRASWLVLRGSTMACLPSWPAQCSHPSFEKSMPFQKAWPNPPQHTPSRATLAKPFDPRLWATRGGPRRRGIVALGPGGCGCRRANARCAASPPALLRCGA